MEEMQDTGECLLLLFGLVSFLETYKKPPSAALGVEGLSNVGQRLGGRWKLDLERRQPVTWICEHSEEGGRKSGPGSGGLLQGKEGVAFTWGEVWFLRSDIC